MNIKRSIKEITSKSKENFNHKKSLIDGLQEVSKYQDLHWSLRKLIPSSSKRKKWDSPSDLKRYLNHRLSLVVGKSLTKSLDRVRVVSNVETFHSATISIEWAKNRTWGNCPKATLETFDSNGYIINRYQSERITGSGYCKESTAFAQAVNQSNEILSALLKEYNWPNNSKKTAREIFTYGVSVYETPYLSGGVGVDCYFRNFTSVGYTMKKVASGKTFDSWTITKGVKRTS